MYPGIYVFQVVLVVKNPPTKAGDIRDVGSIPGLGRSLGGRHINPLQYFHLENPTNRGAWAGRGRGIRSIGSQRIGQD